jgi:hypothetical protein
VRCLSATVAVRPARRPSNADGHRRTAPSLRFDFLTRFGHFSADAHFVERFWLSSDGTRLLYSIVLNDLETLVQPVEQRRSWIQLPGETFDPFPCIEESLR